MNKVRHGRTTRSCWTWSSWRCASCCRSYQFPGDDIPIIRGSALMALEGETPELGEPSILKLMEAVRHATSRSRSATMDKPFLMPVEDVFSISGRGTVVTGRVERGIVKVGEEIEIVGLQATMKTVVTGVEMFRKLLDQGEAGDNIGRAAARHEARGSRARPGAGEAGLDHAAHEVQGRGLHPDEGGGWPSHAVLHQLPAAVLLPHDGRDRAW